MFQTANELLSDFIENPAVLEPTPETALIAQRRASGQPSSTLFKEKDYGLPVEQPNLSPEFRKIIENFDKIWDKTKAKSIEKGEISDRVQLGITVQHFHSHFRNAFHSRLLEKCKNMTADELAKLQSSTPTAELKAIHMQLDEVKILSHLLRLKHVATKFEDINQDLISNLIVSFATKFEDINQDLISNLIVSFVLQTHM
ncbi:uncharacterized protein PGTG_17516 [Puccinia graminis f. sp. tritici CRL 75-36-700-3]|uniref:Uncharacterized protein n=1 Tax=Puccinia graminis f. sp. tritici (strain CRL 75-36-700-3 / race SCCL) TaxID=418459 RepID=E3L535_PUCGT|nr:uncharacterized protein PGTG_17516 [Puccinia graminis f. sp. tritici CRL 75-36-700-3]EFP91660.2 hypothetical protein PGTG_17516 [Puccinia graminis f. sp. tritici CRL 75-36-700-3]